MTLYLSSDGFARLQSDEAFRQFVYWDGSGKQVGTDRFYGNPTVGYGRNLATRGLTQQEALGLLINDVARIGKRLDLDWPAWSNYPQLWRDIMVMIDFNTGDVLKWADMLAAMSRLSDREGIAWAIRDSVAWKGAERARYERFAVAVTKGMWS